MDDEKAFDTVEATVKLATHASDGLGLSDEELETLCDAVLADGGGRKSSTTDSPAPRGQEDRSVHRRERSFR